MRGCAHRMLTCASSFCGAAPYVGGEIMGREWGAKKKMKNKDADDNRHACEKKTTRASVASRAGIRVLRLACGGTGTALARLVARRPV